MSAIASSKGDRGTRRATSKRAHNVVRVSDETHRTLREMAAETGEPMQDLIATAVETLRRRRVLELTNAAYAAMRADPERWQEELEERSEWDATLADGLEDE